MKHDLSKSHSAINEANNHQGPVILDFVIEKVDYVYPMIPAGGSVDQLIEEEQDKWKMMDFIEEQLLL